MHCSICGNGEVTGFSVKELVYRRCSSCGSITLSPENRLSPDGQKQRYTLHENSLEQEGYRKYLESFLSAALESYSAASGMLPDSVLDYGSGPEPCLVQLMKVNGLSAYGWDPYFNPQGLDEASCPKQFDLVTCLEVAEHFEHPDQSFSHLASLVRKGGTLVIGTNLIPDPAEQPFETWWYRFDATHVTFYTIKGLAAAAARVGLAFEKTAADKVFIFRKLQ